MCRTNSVEMPSTGSNIALTLQILQEVHNEIRTLREHLILETDERRKVDLFIRITALEAITSMIRAELGIPPLINASN